jgi:hypothetical protein
VRPELHVQWFGYAANETVSVTCLATQAGGDGSGAQANLGTVKVTVGSNGSRAATYVCFYTVGPYAQVTDQYGTHSNVIPAP